MILGKDILTSLGLYLFIFNCVIKGGDGTFENCTAPMVDLGNYEFKNLDTGKLSPEEYFTNSHVEELFE